MTAFVATTIERNAAVRIRKAKIRTNPNTSGAVLVMLALQSCWRPSMPVTA